MKKALMVVGLAAATYGAVTLIKSDAPATKPADVSALDRVWIDHLPKNDRDVFQVFVAITEEPFGIFQATSQWTGKYELFNYKATGNELRIHYPQTGENDKVNASARECDHGGFDYCLEIGGASRGAKKYFSMEGWEVNGHDPAAIKARVEQLINQRISK